MEQIFAEWREIWAGVHQAQRPGDRGVCVWIGIVWWVWVLLVLIPVIPAVAWFVLPGDVRAAEDEGAV